MKVACIQLSSGENYNKNFKQIISYINQAIKNKSDLIITPETSSIITSNKNAPDMNSTIIKSACGGAEIVNYIKVTNLVRCIKEIKKKRFLISIPFGMAKFQSYFLQMMPKPLLTPDQVEMLKHNNVVSGEYKTLKNLKIKSKTIQSILPKYIYRFRTGGQFG